jgi:hypothetical protein
MINDEFDASFAIQRFFNDAGLLTPGDRDEARAEKHGGAGGTMNDG